jgi:hypothetical protein
MVAPAQSRNSFSPGRCSWRSTTSWRFFQCRYSVQNRETCAAAHVSRYVAAAIMLRDCLKAMTDAQHW